MIEIVLFDSNLNIRYIHNFMLNNRSDALNDLANRIWSDPELLKFMQTDCTGLQIKTWKQLNKDFREVCENVEE